VSTTGNTSLTGKISRRQLLRGAVSPGETGEGNPVAVIASHCLALNDVACRNCDDACEQRAIRFRPQMGGQYLPTILSDACTACGDCLSVCPVEAISISGGQTHA